ncbi:pyridoxal phosphate-dependent aminotransferase [Streptomyces sp. NPDC059982]|uniref:pyridoxal phosphate-dependent aminotransferase n=1 Tax=unclassified Streptomyces TaxID=2593676 RepID=UPI0036CBA3FC
MILRPLAMDLGAPTHTPPAAVGTAALQYTPAAGITELRSAFGRRILQRCRLEPDAAPELAVTITNGASTAFTCVIVALTAPGDRVLIPDPGFPAYASTLRALGRTPEHYALAGLSEDASELTTRLPGARLVVLNSPSNPTGQILRGPALRRIAAAEQHDVLLVSDDVYADLAADQDVSAAALAPGRTLTLDSVSKSFALAGARVGCVAGPAALVNRVTQTHWTLGMGVALPTQQLALTALTTAGPDYLAGVRARLDHQRALCTRTLAAHGVPAPEAEAGLFVWVDVSDIGSGHQVADLLRKGTRVSVTPGEPFGPSGAGHLRISCAGDTDDVTEGAERIGRALSLIRLRASGSMR